MTYQVQQLDGKPIWVSNYHEPYDPSMDAHAVDLEMQSLTADVPGKLYFIADMRAIDVEFSDIVSGLAEAFKSGVETFYTNPRVTILTVGTSDLIKMATEAAKQAQYGGVDIKVFPTVEEAVACAEEMIAKEAV